MNDETAPFRREENSPDANTHSDDKWLGSQIGPYKLLQKIGEGGMGSVFMAEQEKPIHRRVALKIIKPGMDSKQVVARFEAERQALSMMDHNNIAHVLDVGTTDQGHPYFVMELIHGVPITQYCDDKNLGVEQRLHLFRLVCNAVQHAHQKGLIHRDLKPSNVLVAEYDGKPTPKIIDFGLAKALHQKLTDKTMFTQLGQVVGTFEYMSPEQSAMNQLEVDTRADIYSLGVMLYELLTGTVPFEKKRLRSAALDQVIKIIREEEPPKPSLRLSSLESSAEVAAHRGMPPKRLGMMLRGDLDWIVMKAMEKDRDRRYETANGLGMDIQRFIAGDPVIAAPPSAGYRLKKFVFRNRGAVIAACLIAAALLVGMIGTTWGMVWAFREQARVAAQAESASTALRAANGIVIKTFDELADELGDEKPLVRPLQEATDLHGMEVDALGEASKNLAVILSKSLKQQATSRAIAEQTVKELELVAQFQAAQLGGINVPLMAVRLRSDLLDKVRITSQLANLAPGTAETRVAEAERLIAGADFTGIALETLERNVFRRALKAIDTQFVDQPLIKARLLQTVAETVRELGLLDLAKEPQTEALAIRQRELGDDHPDTLSSLYHAGRLLHQSRKSDKAEPLFRHSLERRRSVLGDDHPHTLQSLNWLGNSLNHQSKLAEAEECLRAALEGRRRVLGDAHPDTLESFNDLGVSFKLQKRFEEAKANYEMALAGFRATLGSDHPWTLTSIHNMGRLYGDSGRHNEAETYYREALERRRRALSDDHPNTLSSIHWMGNALREQGKLVEAEPYYREAVAGRRRILGEDHRDTLVSIERLALLLMDLDKNVEAAALYRQGLDIRRRLSGEADETLAAARVLGRMLEKQGRYAEAEPYYLETLEIRRRKLGDEDAATLMSMVWLAHVQERQGKRGAAEEHFKNALAGQRKVLGKEDPHTLTTMWGLGRTLVGLSRYEDAEAILRECLELRKDELEDGHWHVYNTQILLGSSLAGQGRFAEAESLLVEGYDKLEPPAASSNYKTDALLHIIDLYDAWHMENPDDGYDAQAVKWRQKLEQRGVKK